MKLILAASLFLIYCNSWGLSTLAVPQEETIYTTLVIDRIQQTSGAAKFGFQDIAVLSGVHVEQTGPFGKVNVIAVGDNNPTREAVCKLAGYVGGGDSSVQDFTRVQTAEDSSTVTYSDDGFHFSTEKDSLIQVACLKVPKKPLPGRVRIDNVEEAITFELSADRVERLILPTGTPYIRIQNPQILLSKPLLGFQKALFGPATEIGKNGTLFENGTAYCKLFGYSYPTDIKGVTEIAYHAENIWLLNYQSSFKNEPRSQWMLLSNMFNAYNVLTCEP
jgi:hypothetical protein